MSNLGVDATRLIIEYSWPATMLMRGKGVQIIGENQRKIRKATRLDPRLMACHVWS